VCSSDLIPHGDVAAAMAAASVGSGVDMLLGTGGSSQGILSAAAVKCLGGFIQCRYRPRNQSEANSLYAAGIADLEQKLEMEAMTRGHIVFAATGVTNGEYLRGVRFFKGGAVTHSVVMRSSSGTRRMLETEHRFEYRPDYS
jgi:fructose-1,6-bisphosphatase II